VVHRTGDAFVRIDHAHYMVEHLPDARLVELPGPDHLWNSGDVEGVFAAIAEFASGAQRRAAPSDRALATILFTDIVGSTERAEHLGDHAWRLALERYDDIAARHVESFRGRVVKSTGDGTLALFDGPARAIECACSLRDASAALDLPIRAGLHTGEIELMGNDIGGIAVHIAARVLALADTDEVLVSASVPPLVAGSTIRFEERGEREMKGVAQRWTVFAASA
jgi:class 3 adenylate cyclase